MVISRAFSIRLVVTLLFSLAVLFAGSPLMPVHAATLVVNTTADDGNTNSPLCSLRLAIIASNLRARVGGCLAGSGTDLINFYQDGITLSVTSPLPAVSGLTNLRIYGGAKGSSLNIQMSSGNLFTVNSGGSLNIGNLTLRGQTTR